MANVYRIDIEDQTGTTVTSLKNFQYFSYQEYIDRRGNFRMQLHDDDPNRQLILEDFIVRLWYKNDTEGIDWLNIFNGINKTPTRVWYSNGNKLGIFYGSDSKELVDKAHVFYKTSAVESNKSGVASTVMKELMDENVGAGALIANGRYFDHVNPITVINATPVGDSWSGNLANANLSKALQIIRKFTIEKGDRVDYNVVYSENYTWTATVGKLFVDRTTDGLDASTGLNGAGNVPVILSPLYGNVKQYTESTRRVQESNSIVVLGRRIGDDREIFTAQSASSIAVSPIAQRESLAQTQNQEGLQDVADATLEQRLGKFSILLSPKLTPAFALFRDLNMGDFFTAVSLNKVSFNKQLIELKVQVQQTKGGRTIDQFTLFTEDAVF